MVKKLYLLLPIGLLFLSGCTNRFKKTTKPDQVNAEKADSNVEQRQSIFDEYEEAFVLEEKGNPFVPNDESIRLTDAGPLWESEQRDEFETIFFAFDQSKIAPEQRSALERNAQHVKTILAGEEDATIVVEGHACDSAGSPRYNVMLSEKRAQEVKKFLVSKGIPKDRLKVVGRGAEMRKVTAGSREQQAPNRRVELYVVRRVATN